MIKWGHIFVTSTNVMMLSATCRHIKMTMHVMKDRINAILQSNPPVATSWRFLHKRSWATYILVCGCLHKIEKIRDACHLIGIKMHLVTQIRQDAQQYGNIRMLPTAFLGLVQKVEIKETDTLLQLSWINLLPPPLLHPFVKALPHTLR